MSRTTQELLEFDRLLDLVRRATTCAPGRRRVDELAPSQDRAALETTFALIAEAMAWLRAGSELGFGALADPAAWLEHLEGPGLSLTAPELLDAASLMDTVEDLRKTFRTEVTKFPLLVARAASLADFCPAAGAIRRAIHPNGEIKDDASSELKRIRGSVARTRDAIQKSLRAILRARGEESGEDYVTLRNDRFVIPVRAADRKQVQGVMHGSSATGQTVFIEPLEALELNNKLVQLAEDEAAEIAHILAELTEQLRGDRGPLEFAARTIADLDSIFARGRFAREFDCALPKFNATSQITLESARHPVLEDNLRKQGRAIVAMTLALGGSETVLVISGPNTGGKTVALKTVGMAALSAQSGIPVAAQRAELPLFDQVLADIGDEQSISADLSTFSAHVMNLRRMLEAATERSLVLVDEMGTGTAPEEGAALAVALLEEFRARRCLTLATTHHDRLKSYASTATGVLNAAVEFDEVHLQPTYRLLIGVPGTSSGIEIARRLGLPPQVIERARAGMTPEAREAAELIAYLHRSRDELEALKRQAMEQMRELDDERKKLQTEWVERQRKRLTELEKQFAETLKQHEADVARLAAEIKNRELRAQLEKQAERGSARARTQAREDVDAAVVAHLAESQADLGITMAPAARPVTQDELIEGARVRVRGFAAPVVIRRIDGRNADVDAGPLRMKVALSDVTAILSEEIAGPKAAPKRGFVGAPPGEPASRGVTVHSKPAEEPDADEINVIGCTVEEATRRVDKFIDAAAIASKPLVRIVHGHGTGALRRGLAEFLKAHPLVEKISNETPERGGTAITIAELKG